MSDENKDHRDENNFFQALGSRGEIKEASEGGDAVAFEKNSQTSVTLYRYVTLKVYLVDLRISSDVVSKTLEPK